MDTPTLAGIVALVAAVCVLGAKAFKAWRDAKAFKASIDIFLQKSKDVDDTVHLAQEDGRLTPEEVLDIKAQLDEAWTALLVCVRDGQVLVDDLEDIRDEVMELLQGRKAVPPMPMNASTAATVGAYTDIVLPREGPQ